jgi:hypothetical protein
LRGADRLPRAHVGGGLSEGVDADLHAVP